jgi:Nitroreductase family
MTHGLLRTASLVHAHAANRGATVTVLGERERLARVDRAVWELLFRCLDPASANDLRSEGFDDEVIDTAVSLGLLVDAADEGERWARKWEDHRWSRGAHLLFSQLDLAYLDEDPDDADAARRDELESYLDARPYPARHPYDGDPFPLPQPPDDPPVPLLEALASRRSVRRFARAPVPLDIVAAILWTATAKVRQADRQHASGDPYKLLSSFYTWLDLHLVNQGITGLPPGAYRYDPLDHVLWRTRAEVPADDVVAAVAHQPWAAGSGAALFVAAQWDRFRWLYRHSRAYINLLIQAGEFTQEILNGVYRWRLGGWVSPAVHESRASALLGLPAGVDAVMFVKFGLPRR